MNLESKIPPPIVGVMVAGAMWVAARYVHSFGTAPRSLKLTATAISAAGVAVAIAGIVAIRRAKTTTNPMKPETATTLVSGGIYSLTRNPMYLGLLLNLIAWSLYLVSLPAFIGPLAFILYITRFQIIPE